MFIYFYVVLNYTTQNQTKTMTITQNQPQVEQASPDNYIMGAGIDLTDTEELKEYHTPLSPERSYERDYHKHTKLTPHKEFAEMVLNMAKENGLRLSNLQMKVDKIKNPKETPFFSISLRSKPIAERFFLLAEIDNEEYELADDVKTFLIARNSHDKKIPMQVAIGNKVTICSNLMFGGDISIKSKNTKFGLSNFKEKFESMLQEYKGTLGQRKDELEYLKQAQFVSPESCLAFIAKNSVSEDFATPTRTSTVVEMFLRPEHPEPYQYPSGAECWSLWRLLNAYTYAHRGDVVYDNKTKEPTGRKNVTSLENRAKYTKKLWSALMKTRLANTYLTKHNWWV